MCTIINSLVGFQSCRVWRELRCCLALVCSYPIHSGVCSVWAVEGLALWSRAERDHLPPCGAERVEPGLAAHLRPPRTEEGRQRLHFVVWAVITAAHRTQLVHLLDARVALVVHQAEVGPLLHGMLWRPMFGACCSRSSSVQPHSETLEPVAIWSQAQHRLTKRPVFLIDRSVLGRGWSSCNIVGIRFGVLRGSSQTKGLRCQIMRTRLYSDILQRFSCTNLLFISFIFIGCPSSQRTKISSRINHILKLTIHTAHILWLSLLIELLENAI